MGGCFDSSTSLSSGRLRCRIPKRRRFSSLSCVGDMAGLVTNHASVPPVEVARDIEIESNEEAQAYEKLRENNAFERFPQETLVRFLRARDLNVDDATEMLAGHIAFRDKWLSKEIAVDDIMPALQSGCWYYAGTDKEGAPVLFVDTRLWNPADYSLEVYVQYLCFFYDRLFSQPSVGPTQHQLVVVFDMQGWSYSDAYYLRYIQQLVNINQNQYPERLKKGLLINAPWIFRASWAIIKPWIDQKTASKLMFTDSPENMLESLAELIPLENMLPEYGGVMKEESLRKPNMHGIPNYKSRSSRIGNLDTVKIGEVV